MLVGLHRRRCEYEAGDVVTGRRDVQAIGDAVRDRPREEPRGDLDVVLAGRGERVGEEVVEPARAATGARDRVRVTGAGCELVATRVRDDDPARPRIRAVEDVLAAVDVEDDLATRHRAVDVELVPVVRARSGRVDREVLGGIRVEDVRVVVQAPGTEVEILCGRQRVVEGDRADLRGADAAVEAVDGVARGDRAARVGELLDESVADHDERGRLDHVRRAARLDDEHGRRRAVGHLHVLR